MFDKLLKAATVMAAMLVLFYILGFIFNFNEDKYVINCSYQGVNLSYEEFNEMYQNGTLKKVILNKAFENVKWKDSEGKETAPLDISNLNIRNRDMRDLKKKVTVVEPGDSLEIRLPLEGFHYQNTKTYIPVSIFRSDEKISYQIKPKGVLYKRIKETEVSNNETNERVPDKKAPIPKKKGQIFGGWYTYENGREVKFDFASPVYSNIILHAKWYERGSPEADAYKSIIKNERRIEEKFTDDKTEVYEEVKAVKKKVPLTDTKRIKIKFVFYRAFFSIIPILITLLLLGLLRDMQAIMYCRDVRKKIRARGVLK